MKYVVKEKEVVEAEQLWPYKLYRGYEILAWIAKRGSSDANIDPLWMHLNVGGQVALQGDYVVLKNGEFSVMKQGEFEARYEAIE